MFFSTEVNSFHKFAWSFYEQNKKNISSTTRHPRSVILQLEYTKYLYFDWYKILSPCFVSAGINLVLLSSMEVIVLDRGRVSLSTPYRVMLQDVFVPTVISTLIIWCTVHVQTLAAEGLIPWLPVVHYHLLEHLDTGGHLRLHLVVAQGCGAVLRYEQLKTRRWKEKQMEKLRDFLKIIYV